MKSIPINSLPELLEARQITEQEAVNYLAEFLCTNYPVFGLQKYSDDFRSDILVKLLEKGTVILRNYQKERGEFFNYFYCYVITMIRSELRSVSRRNLNEKVFQNHCADNYSEHQYSYQRITTDDFEAPKIPYSFTPISPENLRAAFHSLDNRDAKQYIVLALKAAFYLDDEEIDKLCDIYNINKVDFIENVQICKNSLLQKNDRNQIKIQRRNKSYFYRNRYDYQLDQMQEFIQPDSDTHVRDKLTLKKTAQDNKLKNQNQQISEPRNRLRTPNKIIGNILDLCERQVGYYLTKAFEQTDSEETTKDD